MSLIDKIEDPTLSQIEKAATQRFAEAVWLVEGRHRLAAVYFFGYVVEIVLCLAYFRMKDSSPMVPIKSKDVNQAFKAAKSRNKTNGNKAHPIDGWAKLLIEEQRSLHPPPFDEKLVLLIRERVSAIVDLWRPTLRYQSFDVSEEQVNAARHAADWFLKNSSRL